MANCTVAITGASSYTAMEIALAFLGDDSSKEVVGLLPQSLEVYSGLKKQRLDLLLSRMQLFGNLPAESTAMIQWIRKHRPQIWIHHHHHMDQFRQSEYNVALAHATGVQPLVEITRALNEVGCRGIIYSGSYIEPDLQGTTASLATPYARSKAEVWSALHAACQRFEIPLSKVVIPNPIGPLENSDRLLPTLLGHARQGFPLSLHSPHGISDYLPGDALARVYVQAANDLLEGVPQIYRPSGRVLSTQEMAVWANFEWITKRLHLPPVELKLGNAPATEYRNDAKQTCAVDWSRFWDRYANFAKSSPP